jgi:DnaJ-class molecular chaperone
LTTEVTVIHEEGNAKTEGQDVLTDYEERVEIWTRIAAARRTRTCRDCGGLGRFWWGSQDHGECGACRGTGRRF